MNHLKAQTDQAAGLFFRWIWKESKTEIYGEYHYNDAKQNFRDLLLDSDHSRAVTIGLRKLFDLKLTTIRLFLCGNGLKWNKLLQD